MIVASGVTKRYGSTTVVDDVHLSVARGGVTAIIGPNGAGKSTLLRAMGRLIPIDAGRIEVAGLDVQRAPSRDLARRLAVLRQDNHVAARLTIVDLVGLGRYPHGRGRMGPEDHALVMRALEYVDLVDQRHRYLDELSGGQRQRAFLAMALAQDTEVVLLDEPLTGLDVKHAVATMERVRWLAESLGKTVMVVLHDLNYASVFADRVVAMKAGRLRYDGPPDAVIAPEPLRDLYDVAVPVVRVLDRVIAVPHLGARASVADRA